VGGEGDDRGGAGRGPLGGLVGWLLLVGICQSERTILMVPSQELEQKVSLATRFQ